MRFHSVKPRNILCRNIAQSGSAPVLGTGGRRFESCCSDHSSNNNVRYFIRFFVGYPIFARINVSVS